jgi:hypothetical protein
VIVSLKSRLPIALGVGLLCAQNLIATDPAEALSVTVPAMHSQSHQPMEKRKPKVRRTSRGIQITAFQVDTRRIAAARRGRGDVEGGSRRVRRVERRVLSMDEQALVQARARAQCLQTFLTVSRVFRTTGRGLPLSADRCHILSEREPSEPGVVVITEGLVITEVRKVGFASSVVHVQPAGDTLVNLDTNFYADRRVFDRAVPILGQMVPVRATPTYTWHFGDGTRKQTGGPGAPYPDGDVTHQYKARGKVVVSVTLNYDTWFRLPGQEWQRAGVVDIPGPGTGVQVCEARPVLVDPDNPAQYTPPADRTNPCRT